MINRDLNIEFSKLDKYTEVRLQENKQSTLVLLNGNLVTNNQSSTSGACARVYANGCWGFSSDQNTDEKSINEIIAVAKKNAEFLASKTNNDFKPFSSEKITSNHDFSTKEERWSHDKKVKFLNEIDEYITSKYSDLVSRTIVLNSLDMEKNSINSDGTTSYLLWPRTILYINLATQNDGVPCEMYEVLGGKGQVEDVFTTPDTIFSDIDKLYVELQKKNEGIYAVAGEHDVILDADLAGILAHEALGHTAEADFVRNGSIAGDYLNKQVASPLITLIDFANTYNNEILPVPVFIDDEGVLSKDAVLIKDGILTQYMHNRDSALEFNHENTGNARAMQYSDEPLIRMRNTAIIPGDSKLEDMIASIENGYYFTKTNNGQADTTGEFMFGVCAGYEIKNGKLGKAIKDTTIAGKAFDVLASVTMVSDEMKWSAGGMCGKKQPIPTGMGGPAIKCRINVGGK